MECPGVNTILRLNTRNGEVRAAACSEPERYWGGRSFIAHHLLADVDPACEPLGRKNRLIIASGLLAMEFLHPDAGHVKIEDLAAITNTGSELLSPAGREWQLASP
jgi:aldehyde:ferredoxin oxidoreductase